MSSYPSQAFVSATAAHVAGLFVTAFEALKELGKVSAAEQQALAEVVACHLRSGFPMALRATGDEDGRIGNE